MLSVAFPALSVPEPREVAPSRNVTVPVMVPAVVELTVAVSVTDCPNFDGLADGLTEVSVGAFAAAAFTVCVNVAEVLAAKLASPPYAAVMECAPCMSAEVANVAWPAVTLPVPSVVTPSLNVTVPVIVLFAAEVTVAVNVTDAPTVDGFREEETAVVVAADAAPVTVSLTVADVDGRYSWLPAYAAEMLCVPALNDEVVKEACAVASTRPVPMVVLPSRKKTVPVNVPAKVEETAAVKVTGCPAATVAPED